MAAKNAATKPDRKFFVAVSVILSLTKSEVHFAFLIFGVRKFFVHHHQQTNVTGASTSSPKKGESVIETKIQFEPIGKLGNIPGFLYKSHTYQLLNLSLDVEADGVTYHLSSEFADKGEMGAVIDMIELERHQRNSA